jgi:16S rRNA (adenine1518-N6/adenine1519-N6)-dimethyltransferase
MKTGARLGQHFLKNPHYAEILVREAGVGTEDIVLEIGPGEGALTKYLLRAAKKTIAIEKDERLAEKLHETFAYEIVQGSLRIVTGDVRDIVPEDVGLEAGKYVLAANIPYYITGELLRKFLETAVQPRTIAFLIQKEVAERITDARESILSLSVKAYGKPRIATKVSKGNFNPPPKVDSAILVVENISKQNFVDVREENFFSLVRTGFASKRKKLINNLSRTHDKDTITKAFRACNISIDARAEDLPVDKWLALAKIL